MRWLRWLYWFDMIWGLICMAGGIFALVVGNNPQSMFADSDIAYYGLYGVLVIVGTGLFAIGFKGLRGIV